MSIPVQQSSERHRPASNDIVTSVKIYQYGLDRYKQYWIYTGVDQIIDPCKPPGDVSKAHYHALLRSLRNNRFDYVPEMMPVRSATALNLELLMYASSVKNVAVKKFD